MIRNEPVEDFRQHQNARSLKHRLVEIHTLGIRGIRRFEIVLKGEGQNSGSCITGMVSVTGPLEKWYETKLPISSILAKEFRLIYSSFHLMWMAEEKVLFIPTHPSNPLAEKKDILKKRPMGLVRKFFPPEVRSARTISLIFLATGLIALIEFTFAISVSVYLFPDDLAPYIGIGVAAFMLASVLPNLVMGAIGSNPATLCCARGATVPVLSAMIVSISGTLVALGQPEKILSTIVVALALGCILNGLLLFLLGKFQLGSLIRYIPYPVMGGFFAGLGFLFITGGFSVMAGTSVTFTALPALLQDPTPLGRCLPGIIFAGLLFTTQKRWGHWLLFPCFIFGSLLLFFTTLPLFGMTIDAARESGWLISLSRNSGFWPPVGWLEFGGIHWGVVGLQLGAFLVLFVINAISLLLDASGIEMLTKQDIDLNSDLKQVGASNIALGFLGGTAGVHSLGNTAFTTNIAGVHRLSIFVYAGICALTLVFGPLAVTMLPVPLLGGLLVFLGLGFLYDWVIAGLKKLPLLDYVLVLFILAAIAILGVLEGVGLGIILAVFLFAYNYSKVSIVKVALPGDLLDTYVDRLSDHQKILDQYGAEIQAYILQGFLFFGSANRLLEEIQERLNAVDLPPVRFLLLDFRLVDQIDVSIAQGFEKLMLLGEKQSFDIILTDLPPAVKEMLENLGLFQQAGPPAIHVFDEISIGAAWCQDQLLELHQAPAHPSLALPELLKDVIPEPTQRLKLQEFFLHRKIETETELFKQGDPAESLFFLERGKIDVFLYSQGRSRRLRTLGPGGLVGEMALYSKGERSATARAHAGSEIWELTQDQWDHLASEHPEIAERFHVYVVQLLAERLKRSNTRMARALS